MFVFKAPLRFAFCFLAALAVIVVFSGAGCQPPQKQAGPPEKITVAYSVGPSLVHVAFAKGFFAEEGLDATPQSYDRGKQALDAVIMGKADLATAADTPIMLAVMNGKQIAVIAVIQTSNTNQAIIAKRDRGIAGPSDLIGKKIGVALGTSSHYFLDSILLFHGIDRRQVTIVDIGPEMMSAAFRMGRVDAVSTWNPALTMKSQEVGKNFCMIYNQKVYTFDFCTVASQEFVRKNPEKVKKFLRALIKAEQFAKRHPDEAVLLAARFTGADEGLFRNAWELYDYRVTLDQSLLVNLEDQSRWALRNWLTTQKDMPNYLHFVYLDGLQAVKPEAVRIIR